MKLKSLFCRHQYEKVFVKELQRNFYLHSKCTKCGKEKLFEKYDYPPTGRMRG